MNAQKFLRILESEKRSKSGNFGLIWSNFVLKKVLSVCNTLLHLVILRLLIAVSLPY